MSDAALSDVDRRIADLERRVVDLERERAARRMIGPIEAKPATESIPLFPGFLPLVPSPSLPNIGESRCPKCGIALGQVMSYYCPNAGCPTGLGGAVCDVVQG